MPALRSSWNGFAVCLIAFALLYGCSSGGSDPSEAGQSSGTAGESAGESTPPVASIGANVTVDASEGEDAGPAKGTAEWCLVEIMNVRRAPISTDKTAAEVSQLRTERNRQIVKLATDAIGLLHSDTAKEELFNEAVKQLMEARLDLALVDANEVDALYEDQDVIFKRNAKSKAAAEASFAVARFAHTRARDFAAKEPGWLDEFSRQAQSFATNFPEEEARAVSLLFAAGSSCESFGKRDDAIACYTLLREKFPKSPQSQQIVSVMRRMQLEGKPVQLAGETLGGDFLSIDKFAGKPVVAVFWATDNPHCKHVLPRLVELWQKYESAGLQLIGVSLDDDQAALEAYLNENQWTWPQLFDSSTEKRRWKNEVVKYYGVRNIPLVWLIDAQGVVVNAQADVENLEEQLLPLLKEQKPAKKEPPAKKAQPATKSKKK